MSAPTTIRMTLTGCLKGKTKKFNNVLFIDGVHLFTGSPAEVIGISKYFTTSYQVEVEEVTAKSLKAEIEAKKEAEEEAKPEPTKENTDDDDDLLGEKTEAEVAEMEEAKTDPPLPNERQKEIIAAVNCIEKDKWVDQQSSTPRPKVKDIQTLTDDPTISRNEIVEVIKTWLS